MNPLRLRLRNYGCFPWLDLDLPTGCVAVLGENGAGKSTIVSAIDVAIFGPESRSLADQLSDIAAPDDELLVELELDHAGELYRIRRTFSARGRGKSTLDFERGRLPEHSGDDLGPEWGPLTGESVKATQELIERTLGLSRETFRASAFLAQGDGAAFTEAAPRDRKRILAEVLGLDRWDVLLEAARVQSRELDWQRLRLEGQIGAAEDLVKTKPDVERERTDAIAAEIDAADEVADRERAHLELGKRWTDAKTKVEQRRAHEAELQTARQRRDQLDVLNTAADEAVRAKDATEAELEMLTREDVVASLEQTQVQLAQQQRDYRDRQEAAAAARRERDRADDLRVEAVELAEQLIERGRELRAKADAMDLADDVHCQTCGQPVADEAKARAIAELRRLADEVEAQRERTTAVAARQAELVAEGDRLLAENPVAEPDAQEIDEVDQALRTAREQVAQRARLDERLVALKATIEKRPATDALLEADQAVTARERMLDALGEPVDIDAIEREGLAAKRALDAARAQLLAAQQAKARLDERLAAIARAEEEIVKHAIELERIRADLDVYAQLERAFGPNGIPMLVVEATAIPQIEADASRILTELGTSFRVELRTQATLKSGDGLRDTLDVIVQTDAGERPYETFSGGERTRLNLALRIALARLLAHRRGADSQLLAIDEPEFLDEPGTAALVDVLRGLLGDFERIYLISHVPALRDSFDDVLTVVKDDDGRSSVSDAGVFEEATA